MHKIFSYFYLAVFSVSLISTIAKSQTLPGDIKFIRQGVKRVIFNNDQSIPLAGIEPGNIVGMPVMHPASYYTNEHANISVNAAKLIIQSKAETKTAMWFGGFNPFATYTIDLEACKGEGDIGFEFSDAAKKEQVFITIGLKNELLNGARLRVIKNSALVTDTSIQVNITAKQKIKGKVILQMLGSGLVMYLQGEGLPTVIGQSDFNSYIDLREKDRINSFQSNLFAHLKNGQVLIGHVKMALTAGMGLADIRAITYENGDPMLDKGRLWYTMSIRGRGLPHPIQGVFSMDPTVFDVKLEGIILFDRNDGLLRNEVASHIFYDRKNNIWRGITTGFSAYANPKKEKKQLLAIESKRDPRFGLSVMTAKPFGIVGDIEDPHIVFDQDVKKWRILTCENNGGYKAIILESDKWDSSYKKISGPVLHNSTGTSIQKIDGKFYCFSGSSENKIFIYSYPDLKETGTLKMDLPPWNETSGSRVWPNIVQLPEGYPFKYVALMMDRFNYPGLVGPNWTYGALYLYHGYSN